MNDCVFREYDIRGIVDKELKLDQVKDLTLAILTYFLQQNPGLSQIVVAMDGRTHSPQIKNEVIEACKKLGIGVTDIGICPTPVFYFSLFTTKVSSGIIITASHNPKEYNGMKICFEKKSVWGDQIRTIKKIYKEKSFAHKKPEHKKIEKVDIITPYVDWLVDHFKDLKNKNINAVIDCGNGAAGTVLPMLVKKMGWKNVKLLFEKVDGTFPNHEADPTNPKNMLDVKNLLAERKDFVVGLGLDGDCDRMNPMTTSGYLVPGDKMLALYSKKIVKKYPQAYIVFDIKSSDALIQALEAMGATPYIAPSGHAIIKDHLHTINAKLAGELSCHFFFNDRYFGYDDGIYAALRLFELLSESTETLDAMVDKLPKKISSPEYRIPCPDQSKELVVESVKILFAARKDVDMLTIDGIRATTPYGWGLLRASNTQPALCLRFESDSESGFKQLKEDFIKALMPHIDNTILKDYFE